MPTPTAPPPPADAPSEALVEAELARLATSAPFRRSTRHLRFLRHLVAATRAGDHGRLREIALGVEVFLRSAQRFDPRKDTIVRVEARRLRQKLASYYADEGAASRLVFELPVGSYRVRVQRREATPAAMRARSSVLVLGLLVDAADESLAPLAATLTSELASGIARLNGLRVVQMGAAPAEDAPALALARAREQRIGCVVTGSAAWQSGQLALQLRLLRSEDGGEMWSRQVQVQAGAALQGLEPLARGIVAVLHRDAAQRQLQRIQLAGSRPLLQGLAGGGPTPEALEKLSLARVAMRGNTLEGCRKAVQLAEEATEAMPGYAAGFALLADALVATVGMTLLPSLPTLVAARRAAERALELDAGLAEAHGVLGYLAFVHGHDWPAAETRLLEALRLAPAAATAHARYGWALMMNRRFDEARAAYEEARDLDSISMLYRCHVALIDLYERDWAQAGQRLHALLDVAPQHVLALALRAAVQLCAGEWPQALAAYEALDQQFPKLSIGRCGRAQARALAGDAEGARSDLQHLHEAHAAGWVSPYQIAMVHARLGEAASTLHWLAQAAQAMDFNFVCVGVDPAFDALHAEPGFERLLRAHGFGHLAAAR